LKIVRLEAYDENGMLSKSNTLRGEKETAVKTSLKRAFGVFSLFRSRARSNRKPRSLCTDRAKGSAYCVRGSFRRLADAPRFVADR